MTEKKTTWARAQMLLIALVFFGPLAIATWMYYGGYFQPQGRTNNGALLLPVVNVAEALPDSRIVAEGDGYWLLVYADDRECLDPCRDALYVIRQSRKMLGKDMDRLRRVFLHGESPPDTVFLADEQAGLISMRDAALSTLLNNKKPDGLAAGGYYLLDPLGNLVMYFRPDIEPVDMVEDIKRLLKLSRIG
jgi:hypothetical protein